MDTTRRCLETDQSYLMRRAVAARVARIDINTASAGELMLLRGVGPCRAAQIIAARPFSAPDELVSRGLLPLVTFDRIAVALIDTAGRR